MLQCDFILCNYRMSQVTQPKTTRFMLSKGKCIGLQHLNPGEDTHTGTRSYSGRPSTHYNYLAGFLYKVNAHYQK